MNKNRIQNIAEELVSEVIGNLVKNHNENPPEMTYSANDERILLWPESFCGFSWEDITFGMNHDLEPLSVSWVDLADEIIEEASGWEEAEGAINGALLFIAKLREWEKTL